MEGILVPGGVAADIFHIRSPLTVPALHAHAQDREICLVCQHILHKQENI